MTMQIILLSKTQEIPRTYIIKHAYLIIGLCIICCLAGSIGFLIAKKTTHTINLTEAEMAWLADKPMQELQDIRFQATQKLKVYGDGLVQVQEKLMRVNMLGAQLVQLLGLESTEFNFSENLWNIDPESDGVQSYATPTFMARLDQLADELTIREKQLEMIETLLSEREFTANQYISGSPVLNGRLTSSYGTRIDPITGKPKSHWGLDIYESKGANIYAVASGVVTFSGWKQGYGYVVELAHQNDYKTIYAHNTENIVAQGDLVKRRQVIAKVGSTGRSTGNHVHFEVRKNNIPYNPVNYVKRMNKFNEKYVQISHSR